MKRVLLTGANGFLGRQIAAQIQAGGTEVIGLDLASEPKAAFAGYYSADLVDAGFDRSCLNGVDAIIHAAAILPDDALGTYREESDPNLAMTRNILDAACESGVGRFIHIGSASVYGGSTDALTENDETNPVSAYGIGKLACEKLIEQRAANQQISAVLLRLGSVFGEGMPPSNGSARMIKAISGGKFFVPGDGNNLKSFLHATEASRAVEAVIKQSAPKGAVDIYNVASDPASVGQIADAAADGLEVARPKRIPMAVLRPVQFCAELSRISKLVGLAGSLRKLSSTDFLDCSELHAAFPALEFGDPRQQMKELAAQIG